VFAGAERREIEKGIADRLLELVDPVACEKNIGHMRFEHGDRRRRMRIGVRRAEKSNLVRG